MAPKKFQNNNNSKKPSATKKKPTTSNVHPSDTKVDEKTRFKGECVHFNKQGGFGFIKPDKAGIVPDDKVMVFWKEINSDDRWPMLYKGLQVEFGLAKYQKASGKGCVIKAKEVSLPGKKKIKIQDELEGKKEYIHSKQTRFTGVVKWYDVGKGFGFVTLDKGYAGVEQVSDDIRVVRAEIQSGNEAPALRKDLKVEFGIQKNLKGNYSCYSLTMPGGNEVKRNDVEERKNEGSSSFSGEVSFFNFRNGWGYIKPESVGKLPPKVKKSLEEGTEKAEKRYNKKGLTKKADKVESLIYFRRGDISSDNHNPKRGAKVNFKCYTDIRGAGARDIKVN